MRRRRSHLQVSLFPFLSVLLCTLGALILLLLVLDQKARQQQAEEAAHAAAAAHAVEEQEAADRRQRLRTIAEKCERDREDVRRQTARLEQEHAEYLQRQQVEREELTALQAWLQKKEETARDAEAQLQQAESRRLAQQHHQTAAQKELAELEHRLSVLTQVVQRLQGERTRRQDLPPLYSLVPYKGRYGTGRQPIYAECVNNQLVFRPEGPTLTLSEVQAGSRLKREIEQRSTSLRKDSTSEAPYVLLLVRPSGMTLYYAVLRVLQDSVDIGYELIEEDWALDLTGKSLDVALGGSVPGNAVQRSTVHAAAGPVAATDGQGEGRAAVATPARPVVAGAANLSHGTAPAAAGAARAKNSGIAQPTGGAGNAERAPQAEGKPRAVGSGPAPVGGAGSRDNRVVIECTGREILVHPGKLRFAAEDLAGRDNALAIAIRRLAGPPEERVFDATNPLKFVIHADGLRTYYQAAAALEALKLPVAFELLPAGSVYDTAK